MSYADLATLGRQKVNTILRDIVRFERFGINADDINAFREEVEVFENFTVDENLRGQVKEATIVKNEAVDLLRYEIRCISAQLRLVYKYNDPIFGRMRIYRLAQLKDSQLVRTGKSVYEQLSNIEDQFESFNYSNGLLDKYFTVLSDLIDKIDQKESLVNKRDKMTENRLKLANSIYDKLMIYSRIGKLIWERESEAYYNDYIINRSASAPPANTTDDGGESSEVGNQ